MLALWFRRWVLAYRSVTFVVMGLSFLAFGAGSLNLFFVFKANINLLLEHGWTALMDGGLQQLGELLLVGYASIAAYVVFKSCEHRLVHWLTEEHPGNTLLLLNHNEHEDRNPPR